jgi:hypothetical protein
MDDIVVETDANGIILNAWAGDGSLLPNRLSESGTRLMWDYLQPEQVEEAKRLANIVWETGQSQAAEYRTETMSGPRWFLAHIHLTDQGNKTLIFPLGILPSARRWSVPF